MFVELHMIQNFSPANLNRDDTNNPKDCEFGGVRRARISSQCLKRAIRRSPVFAQVTGVDIGTRTKYVLGRLRELLVAAGQPVEEVNTVLQAFVPQLLSKLDKDGERTAVLLYISNEEIARLSQLLLENWGELAAEKSRSEAVGRLAKALVKEFKDRTGAPDIALFGRMLAEKPELGMEAACQVAHAISTHRVTMEMDFYTAVDDLNPEDTAGAGMMGFTGFDSACFYRYARLDWIQLVKNLDGDRALAQCAVGGFLRAAVAALPTGKQNAFAAHNPPSFLLAVVRRDGMGWSLANAFERPIHSQGDQGLVAPSVTALDGYWGRLCQVYGTGDLVCTVTLALDTATPLAALQGTQVETIEAWVGAVLSALPV